jgi:serine/threonine protein kinase
MIRNLNHPHLIRSFAYYKKGKSHFLIFPWADHGNLREFWKKSPPGLDQQYLKWVFKQFRGLAGAIERLHHSQEDKATRHGDLKPENILCFSGNGSNNNHDECTLVITDVGLSKCHDKLTEYRKEATKTHSGTIMYEPPETELQPDQPRSRRYDVWSLGCIYLEFVVWLLYGVDDLDRFRSDLTSSGSHTRFYVLEEDSETRKRKSRLNDAVTKWVDWIKKDPRCTKNTAIRSLIDLIVNRMLIADVSCPPKLVSHHTPDLAQEEGTCRGKSTPFVVVRKPTMDVNTEKSLSLDSVSRATATEVRDKMEEIAEKAAQNKLKWMTWVSRHQPGPRQFGNYLNSSDRPVSRQKEV